MSYGRGIDVRQSGATLVFRASLKDANNAILTTGTCTMYLFELQDNGTLKTYDWNDNTFKTGACTTPTLTLTHRTGNNGTYSTGIWTGTLATLTGFTVGNTYIAQVVNSSATPAAQEREFQYGAVEGDLAYGFVDASVDSRLAGNAYVAVDAGDIADTVFAYTFAAFGGNTFETVIADLSGAVGAIGTSLDNLIEEGDPGVWQFRATALVNAPVITAQGVADAMLLAPSDGANENSVIWRLAAIANHLPLIDEEGRVTTANPAEGGVTPADFYGALVSDAWADGSYGKLFSRLMLLGSGNAFWSGPMREQDDAFEIVQGDDVTLSWSKTEWSRGTPDSCVIRIQRRSVWQAASEQGDAMFEIPGTATLDGTTLTVEGTLTASQTAQLPWNDKLVAQVKLTYSGAVVSFVRRAFGDVVRQVGE